MYISFAHSKYLFLLLVTPIFILIHFLTLKIVKKKALKFANFEAIARVKGVDLFSKNIVILFLSIIIAILLILTISGLTLHKQAEASSFSFVLAIDSSRSMEADDLSPNRLAAAKETARSFVNSVPITTRIGIISFSGNSYIEKDLTENKDEIETAINKIQKSTIEGTDINELIITSTNLLKNEEGKAIVLLSDGQINIGKIEEAIEYANDNDVIIHTIGIGTKEGGKTSYGFSKIDEDSLKVLAYNTGGEFFNAENKEKLFESFNEVLKVTKRKVSIDLSSYLLLIAILLFIIEYFLISTRYRVLP